MPSTPPWISPADPVASASRGLALGMQMGSQQAAQQFQEQQMQRKEQEDAIANAQWEAEYGLRASEAARKHEAMQEYQQRIASGEDPLKVILEIGPKVGISGQAEAAVIRAQNQKKPPTWQMIPGLPEGVQALQSSAGGIHVLPAQKTGATWQDTVKNGMPGQQEMTTGRFQPFPKPTDDTFKSAMMADRWAREIDKIHEANPMFDLSGSIDPSWPKMKQSQFTQAKARVESLQKKIDALEGGGPVPISAAPAAAAPSGIKILNIRPAGQNVPRGTMPTGPMISPPWPADEGRGAPPIPAPPQAPMEQAPPPIAPPRAAIPAPAPQQGAFVVRPWNSEFDRKNIEGTNRNFIPKLDNQQLVDAALKMGVPNAVYDRQDDNFRVMKEGDSPKKQKRFTRKQFEDYLVNLANDKQMVWQGE